MIKVAICIMVWKRPELTWLCLSGIKRIQKMWGREGIETQVFIAGSESIHQFMCQEFGGIWVSTYNNPLGTKFNTLLTTARRLYSPEYILWMGSDDFMSDSLAHSYIQPIKTHTDSIGWSAIYIYDVLTEEMIRYEYDISSGAKLMGAGWLFKAKLLPDEPVDSSINNGVDGSLRQRMQFSLPLILNINPIQLAVDVKSPANMWSFQHISEVAPIHGLLQKVDARFLSAIPEWERIKTLKSILSLPIDENLSLEERHEKEMRTTKERELANLKRAIQQHGSMANLVGTHPPEAPRPPRR